MKTVNKRAIDVISYYLKKMRRSGNAVSSYNDLNPSETLVRKKRGIALNDGEKEEFDSPTIGCFLYRFCM